MASLNLGTTDINVHDVMKHECLMTVRLHGMKSFSLRMKIAALLFRIGAWIAPFPVDVRGETIDDSETTAKRYDCSGWGESPKDLE
jgi:hypothetical protein